MLHMGFRRRTHRLGDIVQDGVILQHRQRVGIEHRVLDRMLGQEAERLGP